MIFKIIFSLIAVSLMGACATLQTQVDPTLGEWQYVIENLPRGEPEGMFTIAKDGEGYTGKLQRKGGDGVALDDIVIAVNVLESSSFSAQGNTVVMSGAFEGESFEGTLSVMGRTFPITAEKKK
ncbi:MAG: hypothetical protein HN457_07755 [Opitutales bacterium]|jgi:hypothetical protein|nr:hypothetical protein [Opitutales bacterium]MBT5169046.1 hypothetical protein [Opitutales bacterium]MBT5813342.1 hypothetical protein [Opitutales bacterium]MBT6770185.1 hypothetical protein [Opitutales bacterium]MBT7865596.1 hypothetical protein [Opitutales bacterium]